MMSGIGSPVSRPGEVGAKNNWAASGTTTSTTRKQADQNRAGVLPPQPTTRMRHIGRSR